MTTSAIPRVLGWLVDTFTASTDLGGATGDALVNVVYCTTVSNDYMKRSLWVGLDDADAAPNTAATSTQAWVGPGNRFRNEPLSVPCMIQVWTGEEQDVRATIEEAFAILAAAEDLTRTEADLGGSVLYTSPGVNNIEVRYGEAPQGLLVRLMFTVDGTARIGTYS